MHRKYEKQLWSLLWRPLKSLKSSVKFNADGDKNLNYSQYPVALEAALETIKFNNSTHIPAVRA